jgi:hypothetical protein
VPCLVGEGSGARGPSLHLAGGIESFGEIHARKIKIAVMIAVMIQKERSYFLGIRRRISALSQNKNSERRKYFRGPLPFFVTPS